MINTLLTQTGYDVLHFDNAEQAWEEFINEVSYGSDLQAFDLIITDNNLEGKMTGQNLIARIRGIDDARGFVPIIAITGNARNLSLEEYRDIGIDEFLQKPLNFDELVNLVRKHTTD